MESSLSLPSFLYPVTGFVFFLSHPYLYPLLKSRLLPAALLSAFVLANLFIWTYLPQVAILAIWQGPTAWFNATVLVLGEGAAVVAILFECFFVDEAQVDIFDAILIDRGCADLVETSRPVEPESEGLNPRLRLGKPRRSAVYGPFSIRQIFEFIIFLPLNLIPVAGVPLFLVLTGYRAGPLSHWRYFKLQGWDKKTRKAWIKQHRLEYTLFGTVQLVLQLVPVLSMLFLLTTTAGSALWAAQFEQRRRMVEGQHVQGQEYRDDPPPDYVDNPV